jgi:hypothetical protein
VQVSILRPQAFVVPQEGRGINPIRDSNELALTKMPLKPKSMEVVRTQNRSYSNAVILLCQSADVIATSNNANHAQQPSASASQNALIDN